MNRLDDLNRTERYFTSTLLGGLLLYNELDGTRQFLNWLGKNSNLQLFPLKGDNAIRWQESEKLPDHIEVVTELNIKREIGHYGETLAEIDLAELSSKQNVPDVVIVYGKYLIVIEGKFFVKGQSQFMIETQLQMQKEEIVVMVDYLKPQIEYVSHIFLGPEKMTGMQNCDLCLTWKDIEEFSAELLGQDHYITIRLKNANQRYSKYNTSIPGDSRNYYGKTNLQGIIALISEHGDDLLIGFTGGKNTLRNTPKSRLDTRPFKYDFVKSSTGKKTSSNWIRGSEFMKGVEGEGNK